MKKIFFLSLITTLLISCSSEAEKIIGKTIELSGGKQFEGKKISFDFRDRTYISTRKEGMFEYERITTDSTGVTRDVLGNIDFKRYKNDALVEVHDTMATKYSNSVNSVHYFAYLPQGLNGFSVYHELLEGVKIKEKEYYKIKVWFNENGGGTDFEDIFVYWINKETYFVDYLAYEYNTNEGGIRFREAYNERFVKGIRFVDYNNFEPTDDNASLFETDNLFETGKLKLLSKIELKNIKVENF